MPDQQENGLLAESVSPRRRRRQVAASMEVESPVVLDAARPVESPAAPTKQPRRSRKAAVAAETPATASPGSPVDDEAAEVVAHGAPAARVGAPEPAVPEASASPPSPTSEMAPAEVAGLDSTEAEGGQRRTRRRAARKRSRAGTGDGPGQHEASATLVVEDRVDAAVAPPEESAGATEAEVAPAPAPTGHRRRRRHRQKGAAAKAADTTLSPRPEPARPGAEGGETRHPAHVAASGVHAGGRPKRGAHPSSRGGEPLPGNVRERTRRGPIIDPRRRPGPGEAGGAAGRTSNAQAIGKISEIARGRGYGFLIDGAGRKRFFHRSAVLGGAFDSLREGQTVQFQPRDDVKGLRAINVRPAGTWRGDQPGAFERGARRRGGQSGSRSTGRATDGRSSGTVWRSSLSPFRGDPPSPVPRRRR